MDEKGCFSKELPTKGLENQRWKEIKAANNCCLFVSRDGGKVGKAICHMMKQTPRFFRLASTSKKISAVNYFANPKS